MVASTNILKTLTGTFRNRVHLMQHLSEIYKGEAMRRRVELAELIREKAAEASKSELARKMRVAKGFYTVEIAPPFKSGEMKKLMEDLQLMKNFFQSGCPKHLTVKQAWLLFLVSIEVGLWFFLGETIGKFHIVGYKV